MGYSINVAVLCIVRTGRKNEWEGKWRDLKGSQTTNTRNTKTLKKDVPAKVG